MEYWGQSTLKQHVIEKNEGGDDTYEFSRTDVKKIMKQLISAVNYLHQNQIYHRDIKLTNIMYHESSNREYCAKLIDFGLSNHNPALPLYSHCGTVPYMAPELVKRQSYYPGPVDVWALGVVFFELLTGHNPFYGKIVSGNRPMEDDEIKRIIGKGFKSSVFNNGISLTK